MAHCVLFDKNVFIPERLFIGNRQGCAVSLSDYASGETATQVDNARINSGRIQ